MAYTQDVFCPIYKHLPNRYLHVPNDVFGATMVLWQTIPHDV